MHLLLMILVFVESLVESNHFSPSIAGELDTEPERLRCNRRLGLNNKVMMLLEEKMSP